MNRATDRTSVEVPATLEHEMRLIDEAIALVASGGAPRAIVAGLRLGEAIVEPARQMAREAGVRVVPLWRADEGGADIAVERITE